MEKAREEAEARDHRVIGKNQKLFFFHEYSPGSCFFLPHGTRIYNTLVNFIRNEYHKRGFSEVITPDMFNTKLWETSGHWEHYQKNMFKIDAHDKNEIKDVKDTSKEEKTSTVYALKPMNCPGHCLMFDHSIKSYRDLPLRLADFGVLHRNEAHGALTGLTRVCAFKQDDSHIYCTEDQIESEIDGCLDFLKYVYGIFGFKFSLALSTRPEKYTGSIDVWNKAEDQLGRSLDKNGLSWTLNPGDGAFYGPKIDIMVEDAIGRNHQCATIQLDFNLPEKFNLTYQKPDGSHGRPVIIHRAILGSVERMFAILCEHYIGKWPFWLSPRQICIVPVDPKYNAYAKQVYQIYHNAGFFVEIDDSTDKLNKKIRNSQIEQFNFTFVVGEKEQLANTVNVRPRENQVNLVNSVFEHADLLAKLAKLKNEFIQDNTLF